MIRGEQGTATYHFDRVRESVVTPVKKQAVFMPINLGNTIWSIVVATPEDEATGALEDFRNKLILIALLMIIGIAGLCYVLFRNNLLVKEIERRKAAEEQLRLHALVLNQIEDRVTITDLSGNITYVNDAETASLDHSREELLGQSTELYGDDPEGGATQKEIVKETLERGSWRREVVNFTTDGREIIMDCRTILVRDVAGVPIAMAGIDTDITRRKQTEKALRDNRRRLADIVDFLPEATIVIDKDGRVITWNRATEALTGIKKEDMIGKGNYEYAIPFYGDRRPILVDVALHPDKEMETKYTAIQRMDNILFGEAFTPNLPPGDIHLSGTASVLRNDKGDVIAAIECIRDNRDEPAGIEKTASPVAHMGNGESILVVDDVKEQRELAMNMLGRLGYRVEVVACGEEAIECLKNKKTDLVVLDMIMDPGIDGMETYRRIIEIHPGQKAVIVSGFSETDRVRKAQEMGAGAFVRKPYILEEIGLAVRLELDRKGKEYLQPFKR